MIIKWIKKNSEVLTKEDFSLLRLKMITNNNNKNINNNYKKKAATFTTASFQLSIMSAMKEDRKSCRVSVYIK